MGFLTKENLGMVMRAARQPMWAHAEIQPGVPTSRVTVTEKAFFPWHSGTTEFDAEGFGGITIPVPLNLIILAVIGGYVWWKIKK